MPNDLLLFEHHQTIPEFLAQNVGNTVNIRIGNHMWFQLTIISVDKETDRLEYFSDEIPKGTGMEMKHIDEVREMNAVAA